jgi:MFS family permease
VFAKQLGYSPNIVGTIYLVLPIVGMLAKPFFGWIGDKFQRQKFLFLLFQLITAVAFICILFIPAIPSQAEFRCHSGENYLKFCPPNFKDIGECTRQKVFHNPANTTFDCSMKCRKNDMWSTVCESWNIPGLCQSKETIVPIEVPIQRNKVTTVDESCVDLLFHNGTIHNQATSLYCPGNKTEIPVFSMSCEVKCNDESISEVISGATDEQVKSTYQFWTFFMLLIVSWAGMAVVVSVGDAICFEMLGDKPQRYGNQRLWGSVGWGTLSIISGMLIDKFSAGQVSKNYSIGFYLMGILILIDMAVSSKLEHSQTKISSNILKDIVDILGSFRVIVFFLWTIGVGLGTAMVWNFLFWHLEELGAAYGCDYGSSMKTLQGLVS